MKNNKIYNKLFSYFPYRTNLKNFVINQKKKSYNDALHTKH